MLKTVSSTITTTFVLTAIMLALFSGAVFAQEKFTDADSKTLIGNDSDAISDVLYKLTDIYDSEGKDALKAAVPDLITCLDNELNIPEDERWNLVDIVKVLSMTGDERAIPSMLNIMSFMWGGGNPFTAYGFLKIGNKVVPAIVDSLTSPNPETRGRAALTLDNMKKNDESGSFFSATDMDLIRKKLVGNLDNEAVNVRIYSIVALKSFGDDSVIPKLEWIEKHDAHKDSGGTYEVRIEASGTLKVLKGE